MEYYNYLKSLHLIFVITWFAGLFYIVRLFVYQIEAKDKPSPEKEILKITGMLEVWRELGYSNFPQLSEQLNVLRTLDVAMEENLRAKLSAEAVLLNEINSTVQKILSEIC